MSKKMMTATTGVTGIAPNSPKAFGARMQDRLNTLLAKPYQFLPSYADRYTAMLEYAQKLSPQQAYAMTMLFGKDVAAYYPDMPNTADLRFPTVDGWQPQAQMGWYYYAGHCTGKDGKMYGVLFMTFGYSPLPPALVWESLVYFLLNQEAFNTLMTAGSMPPAPRTSGDRVPDEPSSEPPGVIKRWMKDTTGITVPQPPAVRTFPAVP